MARFNDVTKKYEEVFGESIGLPFELPSYITPDDYLDHLERCIETGKPYDPVDLFGEMPDDIQI